MAEALPERTKTFIVIILDESGSMGVQKNDVIGGYNEFLNTQKEVSTDAARISLIKFNTSIEIGHEPFSLNKAPKLSKRTYSPGGGTALFDAIAEGVRMAEEGKTSDERVLCLIMTDGKENSSRETTLQQVQDIIAEKELCGDWTFAYIGENPQGWSNEVGMQGANTLNYDQSRPRDNFLQAASATKQFRSTKCSRSSNFFSRIVKF